MIIMKYMLILFYGSFAQHTPFSRAQDTGKAVWYTRTRVIPSASVIDRIHLFVVDTNTVFAAPPHGNERRDTPKNHDHSSSSTVTRWCVHLHRAVSQQSRISNSTTAISFYWKELGRTSSHHTAEEPCLTIL